MKAVVFLRVVDQFLSLFGHVDPGHRNPRFILSTIIKEVIMQGLHINNTANTKVRGKGRGPPSPSNRFENKSYMLWFITAVLVDSSHACCSCVPSSELLLISCFTSMGEHCYVFHINLTFHM